MTCNTLQTTSTAALKGQPCTLRIACRHAVSMPRQLASGLSFGKGVGLADSYCMHSGGWQMQLVCASTAPQQCCAVSAAAFPLQLPATSATVDVRVDAGSSLAGGSRAAAASKVGVEANHAFSSAWQGCCRRGAGLYLCGLAGCRYDASLCQAEQTAGLHPG